jgi:hypothetical protein
MKDNFKRIKDKLNNMNSKDEKVLKRKFELLKDLENIENDISQFKNDLKKSNKLEKVEKYKNKPVSSIPYIYCKNLWRKEVLLQEKTTGKKFSVYINDYCGEEDKGFIVSFKKSDTKRLYGLIRKYNIQQDDNCYRTLENKALDLRHSHGKGDNWLFLGEVK